jgi:hypothetical protein
MKKLSFRTMILALVVILSIPCLVVAQPIPPPPPVFPLPPPIVFAGPPQVVVLPETEVYVVPNVEQDIFFYNGWWWRPWEGRWYRSHDYDRGWGFYQGAPSWYAGVHPDWRDNYRRHMWGGHRWDYRVIPHREFQGHWRGWQRDGYWRNQRNWGTQGRYHGRFDRDKLDRDRGDRGKLDRGKLDRDRGDRGKLDRDKGDRSKLDRGKLDRGTSTKQYNKSQETTGTKQQINKGQMTGKQHQGTEVEKHDKK